MRGFQRRGVKGEIVVRAGEETDGGVPGRGGSVLSRVKHMLECLDLNDGVRR